MVSQCEKYTTDLQRGPRDLFGEEMVCILMAVVRQACIIIN